MGGKGELMEKRKQTGGKDGELESGRERRVNGKGEKDRRERKTDEKRKTRKEIEKKKKAGGKGGEIRRGR